MLGLVGVFAFAVDLSGSRVALGATVLVLAYITIRVGGSAAGSYRSPTSPPRSISIGFVAASATAARRSSRVRPAARVDGSTSGATDGRRSASVRSSDGASDDSGRDPGTHVGADFVRDHAPDDRVPIIFDAHNIVVELTVTIGDRRARARRGVRVARRAAANGGLAAFVVVVAVTWFLQPAALSTLPIAMIALGASRRGRRRRSAESRSTDVVGTRRHHRRSRRSPCRRRRAGSLALVADLRLNAASRRQECATDRPAAAWFPADPVISDLVAQALVRRGGVRPDAAAGCARVVESHGRCRTRSRLLVGPARRPSTDIRRSRRGEGALDESLERQPWHSLSWALMELYAIRVDDPALEDEAHSKLCELGATTDCD